MTVARSGCRTDLPHAIFGHLTAFNADPLRFLSDCGRYNRGVLPLRIVHKVMFLLLEPADIEQVLITDHRNFIKPDWLRTPSVSRLLGDGLVTSEGALWRSRHDACRHAFEHDRMERYGEMICALAMQRIESWKPGGTIDLQQEMTQLTLQIVGRLLFGATPMDTNWVSEVTEALDTLLVCFSSRYSLFGMGPLPPTGRELKAARRLDATITALIARHREATPVEAGDEGDKDLISSMPGYGTDGIEGDDGLQLHGQVKTFIAAGSESSSVALTWSLILLAEHPEVDRKLNEELQSVLGSSSRPPEYSDLPQLPYTRAVISESLRLYPPLWMTGRKAIEPTNIGGCAIPAGGLIMTSQWLIQRSARLFPDPNTFRPERWLEEGTPSLPRCAYIPFGAGPRVCIGKSFAMMESCLVLAAIAGRYRIELPGTEVVIPWATVTLRTPVGQKMRLVSR